MKSRRERIYLGARVRIVPQHWLRGYEEGHVMDFHPGMQNNWLVKFDVSYQGGGIRRPLEI